MQKLVFLADFYAFFIPLGFNADGLKSK